MNEQPELAKAFEPAGIEQTWYPKWEQSGYFAAGLDRNKKNAFCILLPPPNVTGTLHMGHAFQQSIMDALIRYHRMRGYNTLWQPGTDHAGIATQIVVERQLELQGKLRRDLGRERFLDEVWQWKEASGNTILQQMRRLGTSPDWDRTRFTMDEGLSKTVTEAFVRLYREGLIYRGKRLINWDPVLLTAVSDLEVSSEEEDGFLWHLKYPLSDGSGHMVVATTRPETMLGDTAVMVHPDDERYRRLIGKTVQLPLCARQIPIIADEYVDREFGTGCVKVTPAHDFNDYAVGQRHQLPFINILTLDAKINDQAPEKYRGLDRFEARKLVVADLEAQGLLEKTEKYRLKVPRGDRTHAIIEPMLTDQWFVAMSKPGPSGQSITEQALACVSRGEIRFVPENWVNTYNQWLGNIQDWCISRQLWWGHQIPAWYDEQGNIFVAHDEAEARQQAATHGYQGQLTRDPDVLDTWFSSALWPFSTLDWTLEYPQKSNPVLDLYLPSTVLVTGFDIIFFWVARMVMMTQHLTGKIPFHEVYITGLIRDAEGQKMSKSKGNVLDPIDLIDGIDLESLVEKRTFGLMNPKEGERIAKRTRKEYPEGIPAFGTDALRFTFLSLASPGRDIKFDLNRCEGYRNFCNKLWNAARFVLMNCQGHDLALDECTPIACTAKLEFSYIDRWIVSRLQRVESEVSEHFASYRFDLLAQCLYHFVWDEFCDWYVELAKVQINQCSEERARAARRTLVRTLEALLRLVHPLIPFISEELWQSVAPIAGRKNHDSIMLAPYPVSDTKKIDIDSETRVEQLKRLVNACRNLRGEMGVSPAQKLPLYIAGANNVDDFLPFIKALARIDEIKQVDELPENSNAPVAIVEKTKLMLHIEIDPEIEKARLDKEIEKLDKLYQTIRSKLDNAGFVAKAPANVVAAERDRLEKTASTLEQLRTQRMRLS